MPAKLTLQTFIERANKVHNNFYDYTKSVYKNYNTFVTIVCPIHGEFQQRPNNHINNQGCPKCGIEKRSKTITHTTDQFIKKASEKHNNYYSYEKAVYLTNKEKIIVTCPVHRDFSINASQHIQGSGCQKCAAEKRQIALQKSNQNKKISYEEFFKKANLVHNNKYTYTQIEYKSVRTPIKITCPVHGDFYQTPSEHLRGSGCGYCTKSGFNKNKEATLYYLSINNGQAYKIGITNRTVAERFLIKDLSSINVVFTIKDEGQKILNTETSILKLYKELAYKGPDLLSSGNTELFNTDIFKQKNFNSLNELTNYLQGLTNEY